MTTKERLFQEYYSESSPASDTILRRSVARDPHTHPLVLTKLAADSDLEVLLAVAQHPQTPREALERLAKHPSKEVCRAAAQNPALPTRVGV